MKVSISLKRRPVTLGVRNNKGCTGSVDNSIASFNSLSKGSSFNLVRGFLMWNIGMSGSSILCLLNKLLKYSNLPLMVDSFMLLFFRRYSSYSSWILVMVLKGKYSYVFSPFSLVAYGSCS